MLGPDRTGVGGHVGEAEDHGEKVGGRIGFGDSSGSLGSLGRGDLLPLGLGDRLGQRPVAVLELVPGGEPDDLHRPTPPRFRQDAAVLACGGGPADAAA